METLADALPKECARVRVILGHYKELGPVGVFGATFIEQDLQRADKAMVSGDLVAMLMAYNALREISG